MDTETRNQIRLVHDTKTEYANLNDLLAKKQQVDSQIADLMQQLAGLKRKASELDAAFHRGVVAARPSVVQDKPSSPRQKTTTPTQQILEVLKKNPQLLSKLADLDLDLDYIG